MKKIIIVGLNSFIALHLSYEIANWRLKPNQEDIVAFIDEYKPDVIINCCGFTGRPNIDLCEQEKSKTYTANVILPLMLATECERRNIRLIHIGSGCINYGPSPNYYITRTVGENPFFEEILEKVDTGWKESDNPVAQSFYSKSKLCCDQMIGSMPCTTVLRIRMPISDRDHPRNLLNKIISYKKVVEEPNSITFLGDLANAVKFAVENDTSGIYNITNTKPLTHSILLEEYKKYFPEHQYEKITTKELSKIVSASRSNCILDNRKAIMRGFKFADTDTCVREYVKRYAKNKGYKEELVDFGSVKISRKIVDQAMDEDLFRILDEAATREIK
jgi:3,5-epimerase/4-reductase